MEFSLQGMGFGFGFIMEYVPKFTQEDRNRETARVPRLLPKEDIARRPSTLNSNLIWL